MTNLGLAVSDSSFLNDNLYVFAADESAQGNSDLNGDGDANDHVLHIRDVVAGTTTNLGLAIAEIPLANRAVDGGLVAFKVTESGQGNTDLNGDGDTNDNVLHVFDASTGATTNVGLDAGLSVVNVVGSKVLFGVGLTRPMLHIYDAATNVTTDLGFGRVGGDIRMVGDMIAFNVVEEGTDLNGDGDSNFDYVVHVHDLGTGTTTNLGLQGSITSFDGNLLAFTVWEPSQGNTDLNGDGDTSDHILHLYNATTDTTTNLEIDANATLFEDLALLQIRESNSDNIDLNGDGDTLDLVWGIYDISTGATENLGLAHGGVVSGNNVADGNVLSIQVEETSQGNTDLNGDGDALDSVLHVYDFATGVTTNVGIDSYRTYQVDGHRVAFQVRESSQGQTDLNGDKDTNDRLTHIYDTITGAVTNLNIAGRALRLDGDVLAARVDESTHGDLNGDKDSQDFVAHIVDLAVALEDPLVQIAALIAQVESLNLHNGIDNSLDAKLESALNALDDVNQNNNGAAINSLQAFINAVEAQSGNKIDADDAANLIADAQLVIDLLESDL